MLPLRGEQLLLERLARLETTCAQQLAENKASVDALTEQMDALADNIDVIADNVPPADVLADMKASIDALAEALPQLLSQADATAVRHEHGRERQATLGRRDTVSMVLLGEVFSVSSSALLAHW